MSIERLHKTIANSNILCFIADDPNLNPIEIIVITKNVRAVKNILKKNRLLRIENKNKTRIVRVVSFKDIPIKGWDRVLLKNSEVLDRRLYKLRQTEIKMLYLYYALFFAKRNTWLKFNVLKVYNGEGDGLNTLKDEFREYLKKYRLSLEENEYFLIKRKIQNYVALRYLGICANIHARTTKSRYMKYLKKTKVLDGEWEMFKKTGGSSGCTFIKRKKNGRYYFVKGNEIGSYKGIRNEIYNQKVMQAKRIKNDNFLMMTDYDRNNRWIEYPFIEGKALDKVEKNKENIKKLGEFLTDILDELYRLEIVHSDLRADNIMTVDGRYLLTDFGCASYKGKPAWSRNTIVGKYFLNNVCGKYRYNEWIVDDAASAMMLYLEYGGSYTDKCLTAIKDNIGRMYFI